METEKKLTDTKAIDAIVEAIAFYMYDYATSDTSIVDLQDYMDEIPLHRSRDLPLYLPYIKANKQNLFQRTEKLHYDGDVCDMIIDEMAKHFDISLETL